MPGRLPAATAAYLAAFVAVFLCQQAWPLETLARFGLWPDVGPILVGHDAGRPVIAQFAYWQFLSHGFLHGGLGHLLLNGLAMAAFGGILERLWGATRFTLFFAICIVAGGLAQWSLAGSPGEGGVSVTLGASGGVFGVLTVYALMFPRQRLLLLFPPIPMPAWLLASLFAVVSTVLGVFGLVAGIAHFAHLGGMAAGLVLYLLLARRWRRGPPPALRIDV
jgi:membrane associated rhomboid family serine protease